VGAKLDSDTIKVMTLFESVTGARLRDCVVDDNILFIVQPNQSGKAIGKNGANIKKIQTLLKKNAVVKEFDEDVVQFVKNMINVEVDSIEEVEGIIEIKCSDFKKRNVLIGRDKHNLNNLEEVVKRHFNIEGIKVL
tara:strand:+ start:17304 stop:17711 length:408 start_codon:yes stop_codon:yes gene_type:complete